MSKTLLNYLQREHARLDREISELSRDRIPDEVRIARLKKLKLALKDQISRLRSESGASAAA